MHTCAAGRSYPSTTVHTEPNAQREAAAPVAVEQCPALNQQLNCARAVHPRLTAASVITTSLACQMHHQIWPGAHGMARRIRSQALHVLQTAKAPIALPAIRCQHNTCSLPCDQTYASVLQALLIPPTYGIGDDQH
jgi:hypothetical protein